MYRAICTVLCTIVIIWYEMYQNISYHIFLFCGNMVGI